MARPPVSFTQGFRESTSPFRARVAFVWGVGAPLTLLAEREDEKRVVGFLDALAKKHGFASGFSLRERLNGAAVMYLDCAARRFPKADELRTRLHNLEAAALARDEVRVLRLLEATGAVRLDADLRAAAVEDQRDQRQRLGRLLIASKEDDGEMPSAEVLFDDVLVQVGRVRPAFGQTRPSTPRRDAHLRTLVRSLGRVWTEGTGRPARIENNPYNDARSGPFLDFLEEVARFIGLKPAPESGGRHRMRLSRMALARQAERWCERP